MLKIRFSNLFHSAELGLKYVKTLPLFFIYTILTLTTLLEKKTEDHGLKRNTQGYTAPKGRCSLHWPC